MSPKTATTQAGVRFRRSTTRLLLVGLPALGVIFYSLAVLWFVATAGDTGLRCVFGPRVREVSSNEWSLLPRSIDPALRGVTPAEGVWSPGPPRAGRDGDVVTMLGGEPVENFSDFVRASRRLRQCVDEFVEVRWVGPEGPRFGQVRVQRPPASSYLWSLLWFLQEMVIFGIGARVVWRRPRDDSARVFFWLCVVTFVAYMGGYHWAQIATEPALIYPFAAMVVFLPVVSLHFYLIFPRVHAFFARHQRFIMGVLYGVPLTTAIALWVLMAVSRWGQDGEQVSTALHVLRTLVLAYVGLSVGIFLLCLACLIDSYRTASSRSERNQVRWILLASLLSVPPIAWLMFDASIDPARLGMSRSVWPMAVVSLLYTFAYAFSITRYKLLQAEDLFNRSVIYVLVSVVAGLLYSGGLVIGAILVGERLLREQASLGTVVACVTAIVVMILSGAVRQRVQKAIDRRFHREKYKFDQAMRRMSHAVGSLVDAPTLGRRLLEAAHDVLRVEWAAIYLADEPGGSLALAACLGPEPDETVIPPGNPLIARFRSQPHTLKAPHAMSIAVASSPATDAMIALGGEVATPLESQGELVGLLILGPRSNGLPYDEEELAFLGALASMATLALRSSGIQHTLEMLNQELREKIDKIGEQQRRIVVLQEQLSISRRTAPREREAGEPHVEPVVPANAAHAAAGAERADAFAGIQGTSHAMREMIAIARKVAATNSAVLLRGESGTGKERLAEAIHNASGRAGQPFVKVHCAALSQNLLESELFGHVKGAFTDAKSDRVGRFQQADGGTLFLDEIGDVSLEVQTKLLRVLQEMAFERVGSSQTIKVDVRLITATHQDLQALIRTGRFREDLFYRLNVISIHTPPLRARGDDLFALALHFLDVFSRREAKSINGFDESAIDALAAHDWPGNVRELENVIERAVVLANGPIVTLDELPIELSRPRRRKHAHTHLLRLTPALSTAAARTGWNQPEPTLLFDSDEPDAELAAYERHRLIDALREAGGNKSEAARLLGMPRSTLFSKLKKHGLA